MKKFILFVVAVAALIVLPSAGAASPNSVPTGVKLITTFCNCTATIQANTPFFVKHGFIIDSTDTPADVQQSQVSLTVNGVSQKGAVVQTFSDTKPPTLTGKFYLFNFPNGLPVGTYTFVVTFTIRGQASAFTSTVEAVNCPYGTITSGTGTGTDLLCAPGT
ncbi:MAG: hypothetical protein ACJ74D_07635 [Gaiellaceae bacterium]